MITRTSVETLESCPSQQQSVVEPGHLSYSTRLSALDLPPIDLHQMPTRAATPLFLAGYLLPADTAFQASVFPYWQPETNVMVIYQRPEVCSLLDNFEKRLNNL